MTEGISFIQQHRGKSALLDTNLLLVYVTGLSNPANLARLHHTRQYVGDFPLLSRLINHFRTLLTTPNILTEVSNLGRVWAWTSSMRYGESPKCWMKDIAPVPGPWQTRCFANSALRTAHWSNWHRTPSL